MRQHVLIPAFFILGVGGLVTTARAEGSFYKELNLIGGYSDQDHWVGKKGMLMNSVGVEYFRKFSDEYGDFLSMDVQVRTAYDSIANPDDAFGVEIHNAWLSYKTGLGESLKIGHFDPAFGLEPVVDTHGTLLQTLADKNIGFKKDWGIGYQGLLGDFDYQVAAGLGSGMGIKRQDDSYLLTGRISTPSTEETVVGLSFLYGRTLESNQPWTIPSPDYNDQSIQKKRVGIDIQRPVWLFDFKAEVAAGENDGTTAGGGMAELGYTIPEQQNLTLKAQILHWMNDWQEKNAKDLTVAPVIEYKLNPETTLRLGYFHDLDSTGKKDKMIIMQFYYYGL